jgi:hypothetical protein
MIPPDSSEGKGKISDKKQVKSEKAKGGRGQGAFGLIIDD